MSTNWNKKDDIQKTFQELLTPASYEEKIEDEARLIMARFLSEVEKKYKEKGWRRKDLAKKIGTSPSYMTQLFRGTKLINLEMIAKMQDALNIKFNIQSVDLDKESSLENHESSYLNHKIMEQEGIWVYKPFTEESEETEIDDDLSLEDDNHLIVA